jgi:hypothetical protein
LERFFTLNPRVFCDLISLFFVVFSPSLLTGALSGCVRYGLDSTVYALLWGMRERGVAFGRFALPSLFLENAEELCFIVLRR